MWVVKRAVLWVVKRTGRSEGCKAKAVFWVVRRTGRSEGCKARVGPGTQVALRDTSRFEGP